MTELAIEKGLALAGSIVVGLTAMVQLKNDWPARGLDATVTKVLLGLMAVGCILVLLASLGFVGARS